MLEKNSAFLRQIPEYCLKGAKYENNPEKSWSLSRLGGEIFLLSGSSGVLNVKLQWGLLLLNYSCWCRWKQILQSEHNDEIILPPDQDCIGKCRCILENSGLKDCMERQWCHHKRCECLVDANAAPAYIFLWRSWFGAVIVLSDPTQPPALPARDPLPLPLHFTYTRNPPLYKLPTNLSQGPIPTTFPTHPFQRPPSPALHCTTVCEPRGLYIEAAYSCCLFRCLTNLASCMCLAAALMQIQK